jgi:L-amino acid N-acyltransferase YncA
MHIRRAIEADFPQIWEIFQQVIAPGDTYVFDVANTHQDDAWDYWFGSGVQTFVTEQDGQIAGMYKLVANQRDRGSHVANASFMVAPGYQRQGMGKAMGHHALKTAAQLGFRAMQFNLVVSTNQAAIALWQKLGFTIIGTLPNAFHHQTFGDVDAYVMYRSLGCGD